ncbi:hypothetical protein HYPSUDRAFT_190412 [Hypholoma sublateritium FD-334 SS-4]|uniref:G-protein coupled receptors family 1 profile domain-containing protein n=1 Tax=Hypholoma sublateritium (strain FD-334 SS-4) TaxID=945553 RepID=A0A0D2NJ44_HYPSF|nr:hypothetical protein HYPSUDRAFT_190412 [Hypholoma sublateritium FD-334 SS-4]
MIIPGFFTAASLVILFWELATRSRDDIRILRSLKGEIVHHFVYGLSRISTLGYLVIMILFEVAPLGTCNGILTASSSLYTVSIVFTTFLFYCRLRAVYASRGDWYIPFLFCLLWLGAIICSVTPFLGLSGVSVGTSKHCTISPLIKGCVSTALIGPLLDTSLVFMFIAARRAEQCQVDFSASLGIRNFFAVDCVSVLNRGLLLDGQWLYLSTILLQLISLILFLLGPSVTARIVLVPLNLTIMNVAACKVYVLSQAQKFDEEKTRKTKIIQKLGMQIDHGQSDSVLTFFGGIKVTKTVEISFS